jgi:RNA polymerase sigma factor (sigma-70 family)
LQTSQKISKYSDDELIKRYKKTKDTEIPGTLFKRYTRYVFLVSMKYLKDEELAHEASARVFEKLLTELLNHEISYFKSWLYTVTKNECMMMHRKRQYRNKKQSEYENEYDNFVEFEHGMHLNEKEQKEKRITELEKAMNRLKNEQKVCVELFYLQDKSYAEISEITGYGIKEVKSYIQNGKRNLKNMLSEAGLFTLLILLML